MQSLNWHQIRTWNGSQNHAFEELCCQLARVSLDDLPGGARFIRRGTPDGGIECFWHLPNGDVWGWQAKFFTNSPNSGQWGDIDKSVQTALERNPKLRRYYICLPTLLPDDGKLKTKSARQRWEERVEKWTRWARSMGRTVQFILWDETRLLDELIKPQNVGRRAFWFGGPAYTTQWFQKNAVQPAIRQARSRYTPLLHIEVPLQDTFSALARTDEFHRRISEKFEQLRDSLEDSLGNIFQHDYVAHIEDTRKAFQKLTNSLQDWLSEPHKRIDIITIQETVQTALHALHRSKNDALVQIQKSESDLVFILNRIQECRGVLEAFTRFLSSTEISSANLGNIVITGNSGSGKTHLLCKIAETFLANEHPTILLLGEQFSSETEPWTQIIQLCGLNISRELFLATVDATGETHRSRVLILIDGINEGSGVQYWNRHLGAMLEVLREYPNISLTLSIRSEYKDAITEVVGDNIAWAVHKGFQGFAHYAFRQFFQHYGLPEFNVPILDPEFENPLFLKLLCIAMVDKQNLELSNPPSFSELLEIVMNDTNTRLAKALDYHPSESFVQRSVARLSEEMAKRQSDFLPLPWVISELRKIKPWNTWSGSLLQHLLSEDLLIRIPDPSSEAGEENIRFAYQRFSDYLIVTQALRTEFDKGGDGSETLASALPMAGWSEQEKNWVEAAATISPEMNGPELPSISNHPLEEPAICDAFLHSIVWRKQTSITEKTEEYVYRLITIDSEHRTATFNTLLSVAARVGHPLNANWLDKHLLGMDLATRDAIWSTAIFGGWEEDTGVKRLIEWAWQENLHSGLSDEAARLSALSLTWMLTTSDRFVRDRSTKALVSLLENRLSILIYLLNHFEKINDPYLKERLYAVTYGCALRTNDLTNLQKVGQLVYDTIFRGENPPASVLLRDHARGIVETTIRHGIKLDFEKHLITPPYFSTPPDEPASLIDLENQYRYKTFDEEHQSLRHIYHSVIFDDFNNYIVPKVCKWSGYLGGATTKNSPRLLFKSILSKLPKTIADHLKEASKYYEKVNSSWITPQECDQLSKLIIKFETELPSILDKEDTLKFFSCLKPYLEDPRAEQYRSYFDPKLFQRLILQQVLDLGWQSTLFNEFDHNVPNYDRKSHKPERIGKKYQWIAYDELHARISDNYGPADEESRDEYEDEEWQQGLWTTSYRNIDPSLLLRHTHVDGWGTNHSNWWTAHNYDSWLSKPTPIEWLRSSQDLPPPEDFIQPTNSSDESWLLLNGYHQWRRKVESQEEWEPKRDRQELHYIIRSYIVKEEHLSDLLKWAKNQHWINDRLPSPSRSDYSNLHLFEHYFCPHFDNSLDEDWINWSHPENDLPHPVLPTTTEYLCENSNYDCSLDATISISLPSRWIAEKLELHPKGRNGDFSDSTGSTICFDPSTRERGHNGLLIKESALQKLLAKEKMAIFWTLLGEKNYYPPEMSSSWLGRLTILGTYSWNNGTVDGNFRTEFQEGHD